MKNGINLKGEVKYELFRKDGSVEVEIVKNTISSDLKEIIAKALTTTTAVDMAFDDLFNSTDKTKVIGNCVRKDGIMLKESTGSEYHAVDMTDQAGISIGVSYSSNVFTAVGWTDEEDTFNGALIGVGLTGTPTVVNGSPKVATETISKTIGSGDSLKITWTITVS